MSGFGGDQGAGGTAVAVLRSTGEPGKASPIRGGGRTEKRTRRREPGKIVAVWSSVSQRAWAASVRCGELSGAKVICSSLSETRISSCISPWLRSEFALLDRHGRSEGAVGQP